MKTVVLEGCGIVVEPCPLPGPGGLVEGKAIKLMVLDSNGNITEIITYPMSPEQAKKVGGDLMGIGKLAVSNGHVPDHLLRGEQQ